MDEFKSEFPTLDNLFEFYDKIDEYKYLVNYDVLLNNNSYIVDYYIQIYNLTVPGRDLNDYNISNKVNIIKNSLYETEYREFSNCYVDKFRLKTYLNEYKFIIEDIFPFLPNSTLNNEYINGKTYENYFKDSYDEYSNWYNTLNKKVKKSVENTLLIDRVNEYFMDHGIKPFSKSNYANVEMTIINNNSKNNKVIVSSNSNSNSNVLVPNASNDPLLYCQNIEEPHKNCFFSGRVTQPIGSSTIKFSKVKGEGFSTIKFSTDIKTEYSANLPTFIPKENIRFYNYAGQIELKNIIDSNVIPYKDPLNDGFWVNGDARKSLQDYENGFDTKIVNNSGNVLESWISMSWKN